MLVDVVIIEDERALLELVTINLSLRGISIAAASCGEEGLKMVFDLRPRVILLDVRLPDIDGWEICRRLKKSDRYDPKVIFLTAATQQKDKEKAKEAGGDMFLEKPFEISLLLKTVRQFLQ